MTNKYYIKASNGAYLQGHANPTPLWTRKTVDAEQFNLVEGLEVIDKIEDTLSDGVLAYVWPVTLTVKLNAEHIDFGHSDNDDINHPVHYNQYSFAVIDVIDEVAPTYPVEIIAEMANVIKYTLRAPHKGQLKKDLGKIIWYTQRAIDNLEEK